MHIFKIAQIGACRMVGEQFKRNNEAFNLTFSYGEKMYVSQEKGLGNLKDTRRHHLTGIREDVVKQENGVFLLDKMQCSIVKNANTVCPDCDGNWPGDDEAKERGIKYVVTGNCDSDLIQTVSLGFYDSEDSLLDHYVEQIRNVFLRNDYIIGNAILYPQKICHSFVLLDWTGEDEILMYDSWDGVFAFLPVEDVFCNRIVSALGSGVIKWVQYIT